MGKGAGRMVCPGCLSLYMGGILRGGRADFLVGVNVSVRRANVRVRCGPAFCPDNSRSIHSVSGCEGLAPGEAGLQASYRVWMKSSFLSLCVRTLRFVRRSASRVVFLELTTSRSHEIVAERRTIQPDSASGFRKCLDFGRIAAGMRSSVCPGRPRSGFRSWGRLVGEVLLLAPET